MVSPKEMRVTFANGEEPFDGGEDLGPVGLGEGGGRVEEHVEDSR